jgi:hypothetical protein
MNLIQYINDKGKRQVGLVQDNGLHAIKGVKSTIGLAQMALRSGKSLAVVAKAQVSSKTENYATDGKAHFAPCDAR